MGAMKGMRLVQQMRQRKLASFSTHSILSHLTLRADAALPLYQGRIVVRDQNSQIRASALQLSYAHVMYHAASVLIAKLGVVAIVVQEFAWLALEHSVRHVAGEPQSETGQVSTLLLPYFD